MRHTNSLIIAVTLFGCSLLSISGCYETAVGPPSVDQVAMEYNKAVAEANRIPTMANAITRAVKLMKNNDFVPLPVSFGPQPIGYRPDIDYGPYVEWWASATSGYFTRTTDEMPLELQTTIGKALEESKDALAEIRKARGLPPGLLPVEVPLVSKTAQDYFYAITMVHQRLLLGACLRSAQKDSQAAWEYTLDAAAINSVVAGTPFVRAQSSHRNHSQSISRAALLVVLNGSFSTDQLQRMARELPELDVSAALHVFATWTLGLAISSMDDVIADRNNATKGIIATYELLQKFGLLDTGVPSADAIRQKAPADRAAILKYYADYKAAQTAGSPLPDRPKDLGYAGSLFCHDIKRLRDDLRKVLACQRSARTLIEVMAFKAQERRFPKDDEIHLPEDPFRPGVRVKYSHGANEVSVVVPSTAKPSRGDTEPWCSPGPIGYTLWLAK